MALIDVATGIALEHGFLVIKSSFFACIQFSAQVVCCAKCRYLVSGYVKNIDSEEIRISSCRTQHGCSIMKKVAGISSINEANNSICCPFCSGLELIVHTDLLLRHLMYLHTCTQEGERVTIALAAPSNVYREVGPASPRSG